MTPTISVVTYVKNAAGTIEEAIKSVVSQDYPACEFSDRWGVDRRNVGNYPPLRVTLCAHDQ